KVCIRAARSYAKIGGAADVVGAGAACQAKEAAIVGLAFIFEGQSSVGVGRAVNGLRPPPEVYAAGHAADGFDVNRSLGVDTVTRLQALHDESEGAQASRNRSQLRQAQALIGAEAVTARADKG